MTIKEVEETFDQLRAQGATDEDILGILYTMYQENKLNTRQLREMLDVLGLEFTDEFEAMSEEDKHIKGWKEPISKEDYNKKVETFGTNYRALNSFVMNHTMDICKDDNSLRNYIASATAHQEIVYQQDRIDGVQLDGPTANIVVSKKRTFEAAEQYKGKKTAVLNFANNHSIGGAPWSAGAQEESLCRCSTLYPCLKAAEVPFYQKHIDAFKQGNLGKYGNDDLIYTPDVIVFKTDESAPKLRDSSEWFSVDVITSAAPIVVGEEIREKLLAEDLYIRLRRVFEIAKKNNVEVLILGAYGCGAFGNPPEVVARVFKQLIKEFKFDAVELAVYCTTYGENSNYAIFDKVINNAGSLYESFLQSMKESRIPRNDLTKMFDNFVGGDAEMYINLCRFYLGNSMYKYQKTHNDDDLIAEGYYAVKESIGRLTEMINK